MKLISGMFFPSGESESNAFVMLRPDQLDAISFAVDHCYQREKLFASVDVGANVGIATCVLSRHFRHVVSCEPGSEAISCLRANTNRMPHVDSVHCAISDFDGRFDITHINNRACGHSALLVEIEHAGKIKDRIREGVLSEEVPVHKFDTLIGHKCYTGSIHGSIDLVKIDVQGHEASVVLGAEQTILNHRPVVVVEEHNFSTTKHKPMYASRVLVDNFGMKLLKRFGSNFIYSF